MPIPSAATRGAPYGPLITFENQNILPPSAIYVAPQDNIFLLIRCPTLGCQLSIAYRLLTPAGELIATNTDLIAPATSGGDFRYLIPPSEGFLLSLVMGGQQVSRGQCFVRAFLAPGGAQASMIFAHLFLQGYVSTEDHLGFPSSPSESSLNGRGWLKTYLAPANTGSFVNSVVPAGAHWIVRAVNYTMTTSATVGTRTPVLYGTDTNLNNLFFQLSPLALAASQTGQTCFAPGLTQQAQGGQASAGLPVDFMMGPGQLLQGGAIAGLGTDQYGPMIVTVEEYVGL